MQSDDKPGPGPSGAVRFGQFRFDPKAGVLERNGHRVRLTYQASATLSLLIERRGGVVTREELQQTLWQGEVVTDYESGIYRTMSLLRACLRDGSRGGPLIETLPKRGYRFRAEVVVEAGEPAERRLASPKKVVPEIASGATTNSQPANADLGTDAAAAGDSGSTAIALLPEVPQVLKTAQDLGVPPETGLPAAGLWRHAIVGRRWRVAGATAAGLLVLALLVSVWLVRRAARQGTTSGPRTVLLKLDGVDDETRSRVNLLEHQLVTDFAGIPHLEVRASPGTPAGLQAGEAAGSADRPYLVVTGVLSHAGEGYRLAFAVERASGTQLGTLTYNVPKPSMTALHLQIQHDLYSQYLRPISLGANGVSRTGTQDGRAYELYLQAQPLIAERTAQSLGQAEILLRQAVTRDAGFAQARARLALASMLGNLYSERPEEKRFTQSAVWARQALESDASLGEAHAVLGFLAYHEQWQFTLAERELRDAVRCEPENVQFRSWLALALSYKGRGDAAVEEIHLARHYDEQSRFLRINEVAILGNAGRYDEMLAVAQSNLKGNEEDEVALEQAGWALWTAGRYEEAIHTWIRRAKVAGDHSSIAVETEGLAQLRRAGMRGYAAYKARTLAASGISAGSASSQELAQWYGFAGDREAALRILGQEVAKRDDAVLSMRVNPAFFLLYGDPRFSNLLHRLDLGDHDSAFSTYASLPTTSAE